MTSEWDNSTEGYYDDKSLPDEHRLLGRLLHNYDSSGRPVFNASHAITVKFGLTLIQIADMVRVLVSIAYMMCVLVILHSWCVHKPR